jgi:RNA polymerase sigma factor (sigma-70 family)
MEAEARMARGISDLVGHLRRRAAARPGGAHPPPDAELLARFAAAGDQAAFELLVWRHSSMVLGTCRRVLRDEQDSEDAFQAAFLALARRAGSISQGGSVGGWLHQVALRAALRARSGRSARRVREQQLGGLAPASPAAGPCAEAAGAELGAALDEEVARLPQEYREAVVLCCLSGKSNAEAARELGCAVGTVESRLARARQRLRAALERRGHEAPAALPGVAAPPGLVSATAGAAVAFAAGRAVPGAGAAAALAEEILGEMVMGKLKGLGALALAACLLGLGAFWLGQGGRVPQQHAAAAPAPLPARRQQPPGIDLCLDWLTITKEDNDGADAHVGLFAVAATGADLTAPELYRRAARGDLPAGGAALVGRLPGARSVSDDMEVVSFRRAGGEITAVVKHAYCPEQHHVNKVFFVRAELPPLPPGRYRVTVRFASHQRDGDKVADAPDARPQFEPLTCTFVVPPAAAVGGGGAKAPADADLLQGRWAAVTVEADGKAMPQADLKRRGIVLSFGGGDFTLQEADAEHFPHGTFRIDPTARPKAMDFDQQRLFGPAGGKADTSLAIYKLEGDTLTVCQAAPGGKRPTEFRAAAGSGRQLTVFQRQRP